jgi:hypothetical protein
LLLLLLLLLLRISIMAVKNLHVLGAKVLFCLWCWFPVTEDIL